MQRIRYSWFWLRIHIWLICVLTQYLLFGIPDDSLTNTQKADRIEKALNELEAVHPEDHDSLLPLRDIVEEYRGLKN